jgi:hypothetical protein
MAPIPPSLISTSGNAGIVPWYSPMTNFSPGSPATRVSSSKQDSFEPVATITVNLELSPDEETPTNILETPGHADLDT